MKKYYFFAALATVGLFASCSSDEDFSDASEARQAVVVDDNAPAQINISVDAPETRGTGMVGGTTTTGNVWQGQTFNVFMFDKGTFIPTKDGANDIFNNQVLTTEPNSTAAAYVIDEKKQFFYFPATGAYSFFAYRIDDAGTGTAGAGVPVGVATAAASYTWAAYAGTDAATRSGDEDPTTSTVGAVGDIYVNNNSGDKFECTAVAGDAATEVTVPFEIDGTQDLLIGVAKEEAAKTKLMGKVNTLTDAEAEAKIYSAYAARRDVNPQLKFTHLLTRLYFYVIADASSRDVSEAATHKTSSSSERTGFQVTSITVQSKSKGNIIAAYKSSSPKAAQYATASNRIEWTDATQKWDDPASLATFSLKQREKTVAEKAAYGFYSRNKGAASGTIPNTWKFDGTNDEAVANAGNFDLDDNDVVYTAEGLDAKTGKPLAVNKTNLAAAKADAGITTVYYAFYKAGNHAATTTPWSEPTYTDTEDATAKLVDLEEITPKWTGYTPASTAVGAQTEYTATAKSAAENYADNANTALTEGVPYADKAALEAKTGANKLTSTADGNYKIGTADSKYYTLAVLGGEVSSVVEITATAGQTAQQAYDAARNGATSITTCADLTAAQADAATKTSTGTFFYATTDGKYYSIPVTYTPANEGTPVETSVGESMFVAPADVNGYDVTINYTYSKKLTASTCEDANGTATVHVKRTIDNGGAKEPAAFNTGKSYKITIKLYKNGEISFDAETDLSELEGLEDDTEQGIDEVYDAE